MGEPPEGAYRCSECGHGQHLYACAEAIIHGRLLPDGTVTEDDTSQVGVCESSIDCEAHPLPEHVLERWIAGQWTRWRECAHRTDRGWRCVGGHVQSDYGTGWVCAECDGAGGQWMPVEKLVGARSGGQDGE